MVEPAQGPPDAEPLGPANPPLVVVLSGPSGVGKDAVIERMQRMGYPVTVPVTMTTRAPREGEQEGIDYVFRTPEEFRAQIERGELLEYALVYGGHLYGVPRSELERAIARGRHVVMRVDVQGARTLMEKVPGGLFVFLVPSSRSDLEGHLRARGSEDPGQLAERLAAIDREYGEQQHFDYVLENVEGDIAETVRRLAQLMRSRVLGGARDGAGGDRAGAGA